MRVGKVLLVAAAAAFFLLLLSALVVSSAPEGAAGDGATAPSQLQAQFLPLALPGQDAAVATKAHIARALPLAALSLAALCLPALICRDANGRVVRAKRYEDSFYQVFRQEVAGG